MKEGGNGIGGGGPGRPLRRMEAHASHARRAKEIESCKQAEQDGGEDDGTGALHGGASMRAVPLTADFICIEDKGLPGR